MASFNENVVEQATLVWLEEQGYAVAYGPAIAPEEPNAERERYEEALLPQRVEAALQRLNSDASQEARAEALGIVRGLSNPALIEANRTAHRYLTEGVEVEVIVNGERRDGSSRTTLLTSRTATPATSRTGPRQPALFD